jgi:fatty acid desaturase
MCLGITSYLYWEEMSQEKGPHVRFLQVLHNKLSHIQERSWSVIAQVSLGSVAGLCMAQMTFFLERMFWGMTFTAPAVIGVVFPFLVTLVFPLLEELTFRGYFDYQLQGCATVHRMIAVAGLFALAHYRTGRLGFFCCTKAFILGLVLGGVREGAGLPASIIAHSVHNIAVELL